MSLADTAPAPGAPPTPLDPRLLVSEIYASIQGESTFVGLPCAFVRLTGCPLRCVWCDTEYAFHGGTRIAVSEIVERVLAFGLPLVEVTGGEPLAQPECLALLRSLCDAGLKVLLETSGAIEVSGVDPRVVKIVDVKCPGSGEERSNRWENLAALGPRDEVKFVLAGREDYDYARRVIAERRLAGRVGVLFSPVHGAIDPAELARWIGEDRLPVRLQLQLHKILWPAATRGV